MSNSKATRGERIKAARQRATLTQEKLAKRAGVTRNTINRVENELAAPSLRLLERLARILDVRLAKLV